MIDDRALISRAIESTGASRYPVLWAAALPLAAWALVRVFGLETGRLLATAMLFTPLAAVAALFLAGVGAAVRNWAVGLLASLAAASLLAAVLPRALGNDSVEPEGRETLVVLSANAYRGQASAASLLALVDRHRPDVLSVQELTPALSARLQALGVGRRLPYSVLAVAPKGHGAGLYARHPLARLPERPRLLFRMPRARMLLPGGRRVRLAAVHPQPPNMSFDQWQDGLRGLPHPGGDEPWLLVGDFNATQDHAEFRTLLDRGYRDAGEVTGNGLEPTWPGPGQSPWGLIAIDHVLADERLGVADYGVEELKGSDHDAIRARLVLPWRSRTDEDGGGRN